MDASTPQGKASPYAARIRHSSTLKNRLTSEGNEDEVTKTLRRILQSQKEAMSMEQTVRKIDEALHIFSSKIRHANYLQERQHTYVRKLDQMQKEVYGLKLKQKQRDMDQSDKQIIDELLRRIAEYKEESDRFFVLLQEVRRKVGHMDRCIKMLEKQNEQLRKENVELNRELKLQAMRKKDIPKVTLTEAIDKFLEEKSNEQHLIYNFVRDTPCNERFLDQLGKFVDSLLKVVRDRSSTPQRLPTLGSSRTAPSNNRPKLYSLNRLRKTPIPGF